MFERVLRWLALAAGGVLLGMMGLVLFDVVMRYGLRLPFLGAYEMTELAMALIVFLALPYCAATGGHVEIDLLAKTLDRPSLRWLGSVIHLVGAALLVVMAWYTVKSAWGSHQRGEASNMLKIELYPFELVAALGLLLMSAVLAINAWKSLYPADRKENA